MFARAGAFTLLEVMVAVSIFLLLAGGIFVAIQTATTASSELAVSQLESGRNAAFQRFCRRMFTDLPAEAQLDLRIRKWSGRGDVVELLMWPVPEVSGMLAGVSRLDGVALSGIPDGSGRFRISITTFDSNLSEEERDRDLQKATWIPLVPDIEKMTWYFAPPGNPQFLEVWNPASGRPGLAKLALKKPGGEEQVIQFWIPPRAAYVETGQ